MQYQTISDIYEANEAIRNKLISVVSTLIDEQTSKPAEDEKWSIAQIVEHVSIVDGGMSRICAKLLGKAEADGKLSDGSIDLSNFAAKAAEAGNAKLEAPEMVRPTGERTIAESLAVLEQNQKAFQDLQPLFEKFDGNANKFPHPFFGDLSALEWLVLAGGHQARHLGQIKRILEKSSSGMAAVSASE
ncbi:MAG: DinB family protein [Acidobacteria bacterium]|nr:DinB family protein [Acidobacteriota bacterium]